MAENEKRYFMSEIEKMRSKVPENMRLKQIKKLDDSELESVAGGYTETELVSTYGKEIECPHCHAAGKVVLDLIGDTPWHSISSYRCNACGKTFEVDGLTGVLFYEDEFDKIVNTYGDNWRRFVY